MKYRRLYNELLALTVAPFVGVWIEIHNPISPFNLSNVAPFVGVWIEIAKSFGVAAPKWSLPSWECGLKFPQQTNGNSHP